MTNQTNDHQATPAEVPEAGGCGLRATTGSGLAECSVWPSRHQFIVEVQWQKQWRWERETNWETQEEAEARAARVMELGYGFQASRAVAISAHVTATHGNPMDCPNDKVEARRK